MKSFVAALIILGIVIATVTVTGVLGIRDTDILQKSAKDLYESAELLSAEDVGNKLRLFHRLWDSKSLLLKMTISRKEISEVEKSIARAEGCAETGDAALIKSSLAELYNTMSQLYELSQPTFNRII